jgi:hypothetical protein
VSDLKKELHRKHVIFSAIREFMAEVIKLKNASDEVIQITRAKLPENLIIPAIIDGQSVVISNKEIRVCNQDDPELLALLTDAHMQFVSNPAILNDKEEGITLSQIDEMCDDFSKGIGTAVGFKELNVEELYNSIKISEGYEHKLIGILIDIKTIWVAMKYDLIQFAT